MSIMKNDIPILEYDSDPKAVIMPDHEKIPYNRVFVDKFPHTPKIVEMFPHKPNINAVSSSHVETVVLMSRKDK